MAAKTRLEFCALNDYKCKAYYSCALCEDLWKAATDAAEERFTSHNSAMDAIVARAADDWFSKEGQVTVRQAFIAGARWAQQQHQ